MPLCQTAVPVWIMPLSRVVDTFDRRRNRFDVVIIEGEPADVIALTAIYMGSQWCGWRPRTGEPDGSGPETR